MCHSGVVTVAQPCLRSTGVSYMVQSSAALDPIIIRHASSVCFIYLIAVHYNLSGESLLMS